MTGQTSVVTPERFASGFTYKDYIAQINVNKDRFEQFYESGRLSLDDAEFFKQIAEQPEGPRKMLVLGEDWCPDVYRGMPVLAHIAEAAGIDMRVFPRDHHLDIMDEFLNHGEHRSIPTAVFYTKDHRYICHWIERPAIANEERAQIGEEIKREMPDADEQQIRAENRKRTQARYPDWQQATVREIRQALSEKLGIG